MKQTKKAIVTGGTKGIGLAITQELLKNGYFVIAAYASDEKNAAAAADALGREYPGEFTFIRQKMMNEQDVDAFLEAATRADQPNGGFDALVLNAGTTDRTPWMEMNWEQWEHVMNVNVNAPACLVRKLSPRLNEGASILFISSDMSVYPHASSIPYSVSKAAVNGLALSLVKEYASQNIRVNAILPGFVDTPWQKDKPEDQRQRICSKVALGRFAEPEEIAEAAMNIIRSTYMNGSLVRVDGGYCYR